MVYGILVQSFRFLTNLTMKHPSLLSRWEVTFDDGDREFLSTNETQCCCVSHQPSHVNNSTPIVETVAEDNDDIAYSSPMDDTPLHQ